MEGNTWSEHCEMFHQILEERGEPLFLRIDVIDAFSFDVFLELRWCQFRHTAVLYHSTFGRRQIDSIEYRKFLEEYKRTGREMPTEEIANALPLWHFLRFQYVDENIFTAVKNALEKAEGINYNQTQIKGRDGYDILLSCTAMLGEGPNLSIGAICRRNMLI